MFTELSLPRSNHHKSKMSHEDLVITESLTTRPHCDINMFSVSTYFMGSGLREYTKIYLEYECEDSCNNMLIEPLITETVLSIPI